MNRTDLAGQSLPVPRSVSRRRFATYAMMLLISGCLIWIFAPKPTAKPEVVILPPNYSIPPQPQPLIPDRWMQGKPTWLWKLRNAVLGQPVSIQLDFQILRFRGQSSLQAAMSRRLPLVCSNGVLAWILPNEEMNTVEQRLKTESDGMQTGALITIWSGMQNKVARPLPKLDGIPLTASETINCVARNRADGLELMAAFISSEVATNAHWRAPDPSEPVTLETNLMIAARMQIPAGHSVFLYDTNRTDARGTTAGVLIRWRITGPQSQASGRSMRPLK